MKNKRKLLKNTEIDTIIIQLLFPADYDSKMAPVEDLISEMHFTTKTYPTINEFNTAKINNLIINLHTYFVTSSNHRYASFNVRIPRKNIIEDYDIEAAIKFFYEFVFEANTDANGYQEETFNYEKNYLLESKKKLKQTNMASNAQELLNTYIDPKERTALRTDTYIDILTKCTPKTCLEYNNKIISGGYYTFIYGNFDNDVIAIFDKYFKPGVSTKVKKRNKIKLLKIDKYIETTFDFKQTYIYNYFRVKDYKKEELFYLKFLRHILNSPSTMLVFKKLRIDNNLVYRADVNININTGEIIISTESSYENILKINELIKTAISELENITALNTYRKAIIDNLNINLIRRKDDYYDEYYQMVDISLKEVTLEQTIEEFENMDMEEFVKFVKRLELTSTIVAKERE